MSGRIFRCFIYSMGWGVFFKVKPGPTSCMCGYVTAACFNADLLWIFKYILRKSKKKARTHRCKSLVASKKKNVTVNDIDVVENSWINTKLWHYSKSTLIFVSSNSVVWSTDMLAKLPRGGGICVILEDAILYLAIPLSTVNIEIRKGSVIMSG